MLAAGQLYKLMKMQSLILLYAHRYFLVVTVATCLFERQDRQFGLICIWPLLLLFKLFFVLNLFIND
jgi:hypothetical protein